MTAQRNRVNYVAGGSLTIRRLLFDCVEQEVLPRSGIDARKVWLGRSGIVKRLIAGQLRSAQRARPVADSDRRLARRALVTAFDIPQYQSFLTDIGYLLAEPGDVTISADKRDPKVATVAGAQLVVSVLNARFALNAANVWRSSLCDAFYGTDALPGFELSRARLVRRCETYCISPCATRPRGVRLSRCVSGHHRRGVHQGHAGTGLRSSNRATYRQCGSRLPEGNLRWEQRRRGTAGRL